MGSDQRKSLTSDLICRKESVMKKREFLAMLDRHPDLKKDLFIRGFLITSKKIDNTDEFPFYGN